MTRDEKLINLFLDWLDNHDDLYLCEADYDYCNRNSVYYTTKLSNTEIIAQFKNYIEEEWVQHNDPEDLEQ